MDDVVLIPDSRARQAQARRNRLLEQSMKHLATVQRRTAREKKEDLDALTVAITRLAASITQVVRLHHQIWREDTAPDETLATLLRMFGLGEQATGKEETP